MWKKSRLGPFEGFDSWLKKAEDRVGHQMAGPGVRSKGGQRGEGVRDAG